MRRAVFALTLFCPIAVPAAAPEPMLRPVAVAERVYAVVGDLGGQTYENEGLNANLGFVVGDDVVLVINTGPTVRVAEALHNAVQKVTRKPVRWVVNVNSQNHYWHGNRYFRAQGARVIAHKEAARVMREMGAEQLEGNRTRLKEKADGTELAFPDEAIGERRALDLGGVQVRLLHFGAAHTPGDLVVWLPQARVAFSGDIVYTERMLAVIPIGSTGSWLKAFDALAALKPAVIVPGHGRPTDLARATRETRDYLAHLRNEAKRALDKGATLDEFAAALDQSRFRHLANFEELAGRNANRVYLEVEQENF
jgi:glyoxylase-like metal-dependent hydrolase (beta-lactamase superfamily II)